MKKLDIIKNKIKFKAFGKTKQPTKRKKATKMLISDEELLRKQSSKIEEDIVNIQRGKQEELVKYIK